MRKFQTRAFNRTGHLIETLEYLLPFYYFSWTPLQKCRTIKYLCNCGGVRMFKIWWGRCLKFIKGILLVQNTIKGCEKQEFCQNFPMFPYFPALLNQYSMYEVKQKSWNERGGKFLSTIWPRCESNSNWIIHNTISILRFKMAIHRI